MLLESLLECVSEIRERIDAHGDALRKSETQTCYALIDPLLRVLGWDTKDPDLVVPEYNSGNGCADYALLNGGRPAMMVEAKSLDTPLDQRQLLLPVDADYSCRSWGETIWYRRYRIGHRSAGSATEAEANGRQESTRGGGSIWYERADGADVAARQAAVGEEGQAEVANPTGPVLRDMGQGGRAPSAERR